MDFISSLIFHIIILLTKVHRINQEQLKLVYTAIVYKANIDNFNFNSVLQKTIAFV